MGIGHTLLREDVAWLFQPSVSFAAGMLGLAAWELARPIITRPALRAAHRNIPRPPYKNETEPKT